MNRLHCGILTGILLFVGKSCGMEAQKGMPNNAPILDLVDQTVAQLEQSQHRALIKEWVAKLRVLEQEIGLRSCDAKIATVQQERDHTMAIKSSASLFECLFPSLPIESWVDKAKRSAHKGNVKIIQFFKELSSSKQFSADESQQASRIVNLLLNDRVLIDEWVMKLRAIEQDLGLRGDDPEVVVGEQSVDYDMIINNSTLFGCLFPSSSIEEWVSEVKRLGLQPDRPIHQGYLQALGFFTSLSKDQRFSEDERRQASETANALLYTD